MIDRREATKVVVELAGDNPIVGSIGNPNTDLGAFDRPRNYYVSAMGMASSVGLGVAIARPNQRVIVLDGDGAIFMNLSSLATEGTVGVRNLVHVIWDNSRLEITGGQPTPTARGADLAGIAKASGFANAVTVETLEDFRAAFARAMSGSDLWAIVARINPGNARREADLRLGFVQMRDRFVASFG
ncbi:MAG TPA: thiamine pyrophosphate-dependent enzyme [Chloroflexota bacterium]|nr:thiamine pyrophosphate-dependent enzyme [Chloroflexota bacterium]